MFLRIVCVASLLFVVAGCSEESETTVTKEPKKEVEPIVGNSFKGSLDMAVLHSLPHTGLCAESKLEKSTHDSVMRFGGGVDGPCPKVSPEGWSLEWACRGIIDENGGGITMFSYRIPDTLDMLEVSRQECLSLEGREWVAF